MGNNCIK